MDIPLLRTKVHVPQRPPGQVERPRLRGALERLLAPGGRLLLLSAPAGFGKSTLLSGWAAGTPDASFAWLTLDPEDNDPARFWTYLVFALRQAHPGYGEQVLPALQSVPLLPAAGSRTLRSALTRALDELAGLSGRPVVVLDDFHRVTCPEIHDDLSYLLEHWPENARLVISSRVDPPLPMARLRATGRLVEVRAAELRFTPEETSRFLEAVVERESDPEQVRLIEERVEGWAAGLKMVALAMRGTPDLRVLGVGGGAGGARFILEYLAEEVLEQQEEAVQEFLLRTAVLERFCAPLCDAVTGRGDGREVLEEVRRRNLFLVPLDDEDCWFRYHPLFADLLRGRLLRRHPELPAELHRRASRWFEAGGLYDEAFRHALEVRDTGRAVELVLGYSRRLLWGGWSATVRRWLEAIPEEVLREDLRLVVTRCWTSCFTNRWLPLKDDLDRAEELLAAGRPVSRPPSADLDRRIRDNAGLTVAILRAYLAFQENDLAAALELARRAARLAPEAPPALHGAALTILGFALKETGGLAEAREAFSRAGPLFLAEQNLTAWAVAVQHQVDLLVACGLLEEADRSCAEALRLLREQDGLRLPAAAYCFAAAAEVAWMRGDLPRAESCWREASSCGEPTGDPGLIGRCALGRARLLAARGRPAEALELLDSAAETVPADRSPSLQAEAAALRSYLWLRSGRVEKLRRWVEESPARGSAGFSAEVEGMARVRALIGLGRYDAAQKLASRMLEEARCGGRRGRAATLLAMQALAGWCRGEREAALVALRQALEIVAPEGAPGIILEAGDGLGEPLEELGIRYANAAAAPGGRMAALPGFLQRLLAACGPPPAAPPGQGRAPGTSGGAGGPGAPGATSAPAPPEPLTAREREVLVLLAAGFSNRQIADRLFVSLATVKKHVGAVLEKLGAENRTRAAALARRYGLL